jgi:hypothetical protein
LKKNQTKIFEIVSILRHEKGPSNPLAALHLVHFPPKRPKIHQDNSGKYKPALTHQTFEEAQIKVRPTVESVKREANDSLYFTSFRVFVNKVNKIYEIFNFPKELRCDINKIEQDYNVLSVIYEKYQQNYVDLFRSPYGNSSTKKLLVEIFLKMF